MDWRLNRRVTFGRLKWVIDNGFTVGLSFESFSGGSHIQVDFQASYKWRFSSKEPHVAAGSLSDRQGERKEIKKW
jgi:hypothetical protein